MLKKYNENSDLEALKNTFKITEVLLVEIRKDLGYSNFFWEEELKYPDITKLIIGDLEEDINYRLLGNSKN